MMKLRQFELMLDTVATFANALPEVLTAAAANAQKFVLDDQVGVGGESVGGMLMAISDRPQQEGLHREPIQRNRNQLLGASMVCPSSACPTLIKGNRASRANPVPPPLQLRQASTY
jgi:hypothetical protein